MVETSAPESLYGGQFTLSTRLIKPNYLTILPPTQHHSFFRKNLPPFQAGSRLAHCFREHRLDILHKKGTCSATLQQAKPFTRRRPCRRTEIGASKEGCPPTRGDDVNFQIPNTRSSRPYRDKSRFLIYMKSRDRRACIFSHAQTVSKQHTTANNYLVILMPKRRFLYTAIKRLSGIFNFYLSLKDATQFLQYKTLYSHSAPLHQGV